MITNTDRKGIREAIKQWSQRKNIPDDVLNDFIEISLSKANRALRVASLETYTAIKVTEEGYALLPSNFLEAKQCTVTYNGAILNLERKSIQEVDSYSNIASSGMPPKYFAKFKDYIRISPWSMGDENYCTLYYYYAIPSMDSDTSTNWFTMYAADLLLYGALVELCSYTRDAEGVALWDIKFNTTINLIQSVEDREAWSGSTLAVSAGGSTRFG
jgi:hypothetical protein